MRDDGRTHFSERHGKSRIEDIPGATAVWVNGKPCATYEQLWNRYCQGDVNEVVTMTHDDAIAYELLLRPHASITDTLAAHQRNVQAAARGELRVLGRPVRIRPLYATRKPWHPLPLGVTFPPSLSTEEKKK